MEKNQGFKKPNSDYYRLDLVLRETENNGSAGRPKMTEAIKTDYKEYISVMARSEGVSMTKYIHRLLDDDMKKNKERFNELRKHFKF